MASHAFPETLFMRISLRSPLNVNSDYYIAINFESNQNINKIDEIAVEQQSIRQSRKIASHSYTLPEENSRKIITMMLIKRIHTITNH